ncbi:hypothetical protein V8F63_04515 [Brevundimonas sp. LF-1]|uniref:hypothetical protein n=1 Tax=Brevundimonas sp. LF-1 TaxID=3126100 RepID=UPI0026EBDB87|nr:hypothetical protein [Brevundimonas naejangsanensis]
MSAISSERPAFPPQAGGAAHALRTAQSAFFRQAMGLAAPVAAEETMRSAAAVSAPVEQAAPSRLQRPGSLLDIRV